MCGAVAEAQQPKKIPRDRVSIGRRRFLGRHQLKTAKEIGVTIPSRRSLLSEQADQVIF
jgi:hypothetical protein